MRAITLTEVFIKTLLLPEAGRIEHPDKDARGLYLRVSASGVRSWSFVYNSKGKRYRLVLGQYPGVSLKMARERAREARGAIQRGDNPVEDKKEEIREAKLTSFKACAKDFIEKHAMVHTKEKTWKDTKRFFERFAEPAFGETPVKEIRRRDVIELIEKVAKSTPWQANQLRICLSTMFNWLMLRDAVDVNPVTGIPPPVDLTPRERILSDDEIVALWKAALKLGSPFGPPVRLLLLTGVRREEATKLRWDELDGDWATMPGSRMKNGRDFKAPLSKSAKSLIEAQPKKGPFVFTTNGKTPIAGWGKAKERLDKLMAEELGLPKDKQVDEWHLHDLRRTMATGVAMLGYRREVIDRLLAHVPQKSDVTSSVYNRFMYDAEAMKAVQEWAAHIGKLTSGLEVVQREVEC